MKAKEGLKLVLGSVVVYVVMAACANAENVSPGGPSRGDPSADAGWYARGLREKRPS
jgi:hypothetical protein